MFDQPKFYVLRCAYTLDGQYGESVFLGVYGSYSAANAAAIELMRFCGEIGKHASAPYFYGSFKSDGNLFHNTRELQARWADRRIMVNYTIDECFSSEILPEEWERAIEMMR